MGVIVMAIGKESQLSPSRCLHAGYLSLDVSLNDSEHMDHMARLMTHLAMELTADSER